MRKTSNLPVFHHLAEESRVPEQDADVEDILALHDDLSQFKQVTANVECIL